MVVRSSDSSPALVWLLASVIFASAGCEDCGGPPSSTDLETGAVSVRMEGELVSVLAHAAPRERVLSELSSRAGFVVVREGSLPEEVTLDLKSVSIASALSQILGALPYSLHYAAGDQRTPCLPIRVEIAGAAARLNVQFQPSERLEAESPVAPTGDRPEVAGLRAEQQVAPMVELPAPRTRAESLTAPDPGERVNAVKHTPPLGSGRAQLQAVLARDPDPRVRAHAARQLGGADDYASTRALIESVDDSDPSVGLAAIASLVDKGDASVCAELREAVEENPDESVRTALMQAIGSLEHGVRLRPESPDIFEYEPAPKGPARRASEHTEPADVPAP